MMQINYWYTRRFGISWKGAFFLVNFFLLILIYFYHNNKTEISNNRLKSNSIKEDHLLDQKQFGKRVAKKRALSKSDVITNFLVCMEDNGKENETFDESRNHLLDCLNLHVPVEKYDMDSFKAINIEYKYFLPMDKGYYNNPDNKCLFLTVGIGNSTKAEKEFLKLYPKCNLYGVEISPYNVGDYATFGKVINTGIGFNGKVEILENYTYENIHRYYNLTLKPFNMILDNEVESRLLHYATIDIEGFEFVMLKKFEDLGEYATDGIVICQMDVEFHSDRDIPMTGSMFSAFLLRLFHNASSYLPVYAAPYGGGAIKITMINIKNSECELAFRFSKYFQR